MMLKQKKTLAILVTGICVLLTIFHLSHWIKAQWHTLDYVDEKRLFSFVPPHLKNCEDLFKHVKNEQQGFPMKYNTLRKQLDAEFKKVVHAMNVPRKTIEGHSGQLLKQSLAYFSLAEHNFVKTICETGFNAGHSSLLWLSVKKDLKFYSFDLGNHRYSRPMAAFLQESFPGMLNVTWGDSGTTIPKFTAQNPNLNCDIICVDGGHKYGAVKADLVNLRVHANRKYHLLIIDDHPADNNLPDVRRAWQEELDAGHVQEHFHCKFYSKKSRGFTVGKYVAL